MLKTLYSVYDRRRRPLRDHHYMVFASVGIAYARVPGDPMKAVSELISRLAQTFSKASIPLDGNAWNNEMELLTARELKRRHPDFCIFTVVQSPEERVASAYRSIILSEAPLPTYFEVNQFSKSMSLEDFTARVAILSDTGVDNLVRSQASILSYRSEVIPGIVVNLSELRQSPDALLSQLKDRAGNGQADKDQPLETLDLNGIEFDMSQADPEHLKILGDRPMQDLLRQRYQMDYRLFFSGQPRASSFASVKTRKTGSETPHPALEANTTVVTATEVRRDSRTSPDGIFSLK